MTDGSQFTYVLTNASITWQAAWGFKKISIECESATSVTVCGDAKAGGLISSAITIKTGKIQTFNNSYNAIDGLIITAPAGCTLNIMASFN